MSSNTHDEARLTRYLLDELPDEDRERLEGAYFTDDAAFEQLLIAEQELIDAYVHGELSAAKRERFEKVFLASPRRQERVQFARVLAHTMSGAQVAETTRDAATTDDAATTRVAASPPRPSFFAALRAYGAVLRLTLATAAALVVIASISWLLVERARLRAELLQLRVEREALREREQELEKRIAAEQSQAKDVVEQLAQTPLPQRQEDDVVSRPSQGNTANSSKDKIVKPPTRPLIVSFTLTPGLVRSGGARTLNVPRNASHIVLRLNTDAGMYESYQAVIETADGRQVWRAISVRPSFATGRIISLPAVPTGDLPPNDYVLMLSGKLPDGRLESVADYSFKVLRD